MVVWHYGDSFNWMYILSPGIARVYYFRDHTGRPTLYTTAFINSLYWFVSQVCSAPLFAVLCLLFFHITTTPWKKAIPYRWFTAQTPKTRPLWAAKPTGILALQDLHFNWTSILIRTKFCSTNRWTVSGLSLSARILMKGIIIISGINTLDTWTHASGRCSFVTPVSTLSICFVFSVSPLFGLSPDGHGTYLPAHSCPSRHCTLTGFVSLISEL